LLAEPDNMPNAKYQIFISSTFEDLKPEREQVIKACLRIGHIPVGMEMFNAADEEQFEIIKRHIDTSDYYIVIVAHRYGSVTKSGISYTEMEYDYAVSKGVPTLGFVIDPSIDWRPDWIDKDTKRRKSLEAFKKKVKQKPVSFWKSADELHGQCISALTTSFVTRPRRGWVPAPDTRNPDIAAELSRLSAENARMRREIQLLTSSSDTSGLQQGDDSVELKFVVVTSEFNRNSNKILETKERYTVTTTWNELFKVVAHNSLSNASEVSIMNAIVSAYSESKARGQSSLDLDFFVSVRTQFIALNLIYVENERLESPTGYVAIISWRLTELGFLKYGELSALRRLK